MQVLATNLIQTGPAIPHTKGLTPNFCTKASHCNCSKICIPSTYTLRIFEESLSACDNPTCEFKVWATRLSGKTVPVCSIFAIPGCEPNCERTPNWEEKSPRKARFCWENFWEEKSPSSCCCWSCCCCCDAKIPAIIMSSPRATFFSRTWRRLKRWTSSWSNASSRKSCDCAPHTLQYQKPSSPRPISKLWQELHIPAIAMTAGRLLVAYNKPTPPFKPELQTLIPSSQESRRRTNEWMKTAMK